MERKISLRKENKTLGMQLHVEVVFLPLIVYKKNVHRLTPAKFNWMFDNDPKMWGKAHYVSLVMGNFISNPGLLILQYAPTCFSVHSHVFLAVESRAECLMTIWTFKWFDARVNRHVTRQWTVCCKTRSTNLALVFLQSTVSFQVSFEHARWDKHLATL